MTTTMQSNDSSANQDARTSFGEEPSQQPQHELPISGIHLDDSITNEHEIINNIEPLPPPTMLPPGPIHPRSKSGIFGTSSNLVNTIVGAGIVGIPFAIQQCGFIAGIVLLLIVGIITEKSLRMLIECTFFHPAIKVLNIRSYEDLGYVCFGRLGRAFILVSMFVMAYGAMVAYLIIIKDTVPTILGFTTSSQRQVITVVTSMCIILPLSLQRDMASLACTSMLSVSCDLILVIFVLLYAPVEEEVFEEHGGLAKVLLNGTVNSKVFIGLGIISMAMCCQHSVFLIYDSLEYPTKWRWSAVSSISISTATALTTLMGVSGYLGFMEETQGDVLNNFPNGSFQANMARLLLAITMFFTYPMESFVARHVLVELFFQGNYMEDNRHTLQDRTLMDRILLTRRVRLTLLLYVFTLLPALIFEDLGPVLSLSGAIGASCLAYIAPGMTYLAVNGGAFLNFAHGLLRSSAVTPQDQSKEGNQENIELPIAGDATQTIAVDHPLSSRERESLELPVSGTPSEMIVSNAVPPSTKCKPIWWYLLGMPIWCGIASTGHSRSLQNVRTQNVIHNNQESIAEDATRDITYIDREADSISYHDDDFIQPTRWDFLIAIIFILFGFIALSSGTISNIYLQMNKLGYVGRNML